VIPGNCLQDEMVKRAFLYPEQIAVIIIMAVLLVISASWGLMDSKRMELLTYGIKLDDQQKAALTQERDQFYNRLEAIRHNQAAHILQNLVEGKRIELGEWSQVPDKRMSPHLKITAVRSYLLSGTAPDERATFRALSRIRPSSLDFDPEFYIYGGAYLYPLGGLIYATKIFGLIHISQSLAWYLDHPTQLARLYLTGRILSIASFLAILVLLAVWSRRLESRLAGFVAMLSWSLSWLPWWEALISKPHMYVAFWSLWLLFILDGWREDRRAWRIWLAGAALGMAMGASLPAAIFALAFPFLVWKPGKVWAWLGPCLLGWAVAAAVFLVTNPYAVINHEVYMLTTVEHLSGGGWNYGAVAWDKPLVFFKLLTLDSFAFPLMIVGLIGVLLAALRGQSPLTRLARLMTVVLVIWSLTVASDRIGLFLTAPLCLFIGWALDRFLLRRWRAPAWLASAILVLLFLPGLVSLAVQSRAALSGDLWYPPTKAWLNAGGLPPQVSIGVYAPPDPTRFPPFPFIDRQIIMLDKWKPGQEAPGVIMLREKAYQGKWQRHPLNQRYQITARLGSLPCPGWLDYFMVRCPRHAYTNALVLTPK
jgi:hypothetical protein